MTTQPFTKEDGTQKQGPQNGILEELLHGLKTAADGALGYAAAQAPTLTADALTLGEQYLFNVLDVPPAIRSIVSGQNGTIEKVVDPLEATAIAFLKQRIDALLP